MPFANVQSPPALFPTYLVPSLPFRRRRQSSTDSTGSSIGGGSGGSISSSLPGTAPFSPSSSPPTTDSYLTGHTSHLRCARCLSDLALSNQIISKGFTGRHGRAYLVAPSPASAAAIVSSAASASSSAKQKNDALPNLPNTYTHKPVPRQLVTGAHTVGDISCAICGSVLGWKYVAAEEEAQRYKVGKFILETKRVCRSSGWEDEDEVGDAGGWWTGQRDGRRRSSSLVGPPNEMPSAIGSGGKMGIVEEETVEFDSQDEDECEDLFMGVWTPQAALKRRKAKMFSRGEEL